MTGLLLPISGVEHVRRSGSPSPIITGNWTSGLFHLDFGVDNVGRPFGAVLTGMSYTFGITPNGNSFAPPNTWVTYDSTASQGTWASQYSVDDVNWNTAAGGVTVSFQVVAGNNVQNSGTRYNISGSNGMGGGAHSRYWRFIMTGGVQNSNENLRSVSGGTTFTGLGAISFPSPSFSYSWVYL